MKRCSRVAAAVLSVFLLTACGGGTAPAPGGSGSGGTGAGDSGSGGGSGGGGGTGGGARFTLAVVKNGSGHVASIPTGIDCGSTCLATFDAGTSVSLLPTPDAGWTFAGWGGGCSGPGACTVSSDATVYATFQASVPPPPPPLQRYRVQVSVSGSGAVRSTPPGIACGSTCAADFEAGTGIILSATPAPGFTFSGFGGACGGTSCLLRLTSDVQVSATFAALPVALTVQSFGTGTGRVTSSPTGIDCPGACTASFAEGTTVTLSEEAGAGSSFSGWGAACSGTGTCGVTLHGDNSVIAAFALDPCAGLVRPLPAPVEVRIGTPQASPTCGLNPLGDASGNVFVNDVKSGVTHIIHDGHEVAAAPNTVPFVPLNIGFASPTPTPNGFTAYGFTAFGIDGKPGNRTPMPDGPIAWSEAVNGGSVVVSGNCWWVKIGGKADWLISWFDDDGALVRRATLPDEECALGLDRVVIDAHDNILIVYTTLSGILAIPASHYVARWLDSAGSPLTQWFDLGWVNSPGIGIRPLIGGGVAVAYGADWTSMIPSGEPHVVPGPAFPSSKDVLIIEGGRAYLAIPESTGTLDILTPQGDVCGTVETVNAGWLGRPNETYHLGKDGTLIRLQGADQCDVVYFPKALK